MNWPITVGKHGAGLRSQRSPWRSPGTTSSQLETASFWPSSSATAWKRTATRLDCEQEGPTTMPWAPAGHREMGKTMGKAMGKAMGCWRSGENMGKSWGNASEMNININDTSSSTKANQTIHRLVVGKIARQFLVHYTALQ